MLKRVFIKIVFVQRLKMFTYFLVLQKGFTPLHEAARHGHVKTVELLLHHYPSPDPPGKVSFNR